MLVSSTSMNAATATTTPISQGLNLGRHVTGSAGAAAAAFAVLPAGPLSGPGVLSAMTYRCNRPAVGREIGMELVEN